ncbi:MAG: zinc-ribbon domain-containing protein, partial [Oscillospiraceae bacterium]
MFCMKCGRQLNDGAKFCPGCGTKVENPEDFTTPVSESTVPVSAPAAAVAVLEKPASPEAPAAPEAPQQTSFLPQQPEAPAAPEAPQQASFLPQQPEAPAAPEAPQ